MNINKNYLVTFGVSILVMFTISVIVFMLMLPKQSTVSKGTVTKYEQISKSEFTFEATKDITSEPLTKQYSITTEDMSGFKSTSQYTTGNTDPFAPLGNTGTSTTTNSTTNKTTTTTGTATKEQIEATNKTTNSNGGVANPSATTK